MTHYITAVHLVDAALKASTEDLFHEFDKALQSFCNEEQDRITIFRTLRYTRIRLHVFRKYLPEENASTRNMQARFLDVAIGYINTELDLLRSYNPEQNSSQSQNLHRWTGTLVELVEMIYGLQELRCIDDGETAINELFSFFTRLFDMEIKDSHCYNAYSDMKRRKSENRTYFLDRMRDRLNLRMQCDDLWEQRKR